jgi:predicted Fe-Mo cluster-binding NifX family protein
MIYAIATTDKQLAHHFSKAEVFTFYNEQQEVIAVYKNPALGVSGCAGKRLLIDLLHKRECDVVIVRKIGEKTLARLLDAGFKVEQGNTRNSYKELLEDARLQKNSLASPEQGVKNKTTCCGHH